MSDVSLAPGKRLSQIRQQLGLSQRRVAELSGLTHSAIKYYRARQGQPGHQHAAKAADGIRSVAVGVFRRTGKTG